MDDAAQRQRTVYAVRGVQGTSRCVRRASVDLPSVFRARRVCVSRADLVSVTEQRTGAITWVHRVTTARGTTRTRRLVTGPRDSASLFATLDRFRARHGHRFTLEGPGVEPGT